jgi:hypothetical protein
MKTFLDGPVVTSLAETTNKANKGPLNLSAPCHILVLPGPAYTHEIPETKTFEFTFDARNAKIMPYGAPVIRDCKLISNLQPRKHETRGRINIVASAAQGASAGQRAIGSYLLRGKIGECRRYIYTPWS